MTGRIARTEDELQRILEGELDRSLASLDIIGYWVLRTEKWPVNEDLIPQNYFTTGTSDHRVV